MAGGLGGVRRCGRLQAAARWEAAVLLSSDVLLMPSWRFVANISKLAGGLEASPSLAKSPLRRLGCVCLGCGWLAVAGCAAV